MSKTKINILMCYQEPVPSSKQRKFVTYCPYLQSVPEAQAFIENRFSHLARDGYVSRVFLEIVLTLLTNDLYRVFLYPVDDTKGYTKCPQISSVSSMDLDLDLVASDDDYAAIENFVYDTLLNTSWVAGFYSDNFKMQGNSPNVKKDISCSGRDLKPNVGLNFLYMFPADLPNLERLKAFISKRSLNAPKPAEDPSLGTVLGNSEYSITKGNLKATLVLPDEYQQACIQAEQLLTAFLTKLAEKCKREVSDDQIKLFTIDRTEAFIPTRRTYYRVAFTYKHTDEQLYDLGFMFDFHPIEIESSNSNFLVRVFEDKFAELVDSIEKLNERDNQ